MAQRTRAEASPVTWEDAGARATAPVRLIRDAARAAPAIEAVPAAILILGAVIIVSFQSFGSRAFFRHHLAPRFADAPLAGMHDYLYWFSSSVAWLFALPIAIIVLMPGRGLRDFGLGLGDWRFGLRAAAGLYATMLPLLIAASFARNFAHYYPMSDWVRGEVRLYAGGGSASHLGAFVVYEAAYASYFLGWEFFHRGFLTIGLEPVFGWYAVLIVAMPFALMHVGKPMPEAYGAIAAGIILGWLAIRTRSSWYGFALHASIAITMDVLAMLQQLR